MNATISKYKSIQLCFLALCFIILQSGAAGIVCQDIDDEELCQENLRCMFDYEKEACRDATCEEIFDESICNESIGCSWDSFVDFCYNLDNPPACAQFATSDTCPSSRCTFYSEISECVEKDSGIPCHLFHIQEVCEEYPSCYWNEDSHEALGTCSTLICSSFNTENCPFDRCFFDRVNGCQELIRSTSSQLSTSSILTRPAPCIRIDDIDTCNNQIGCIWDITFNTCIEQTSLPRCSDYSAEMCPHNRCKSYIEINECIDIADPTPCSRFVDKTQCLDQQDCVWHLASVGKWGECDTKGSPSPCYLFPKEDCPVSYCILIGDSCQFMETSTDPTLVSNAFSTNLNTASDTNLPTSTTRSTNTISDISTSSKITTATAADTIASTKVDTATDSTAVTTSERTSTASLGTISDKAEGTTTTVTKISDIITTATTSVTDASTTSAESITSTPVVESTATTSDKTTNTAPGTTLNTATDTSTDITRSTITGGTTGTIISTATESATTAAPALSFTLQLCPDKLNGLAQNVESACQFFTPGSVCLLQCTDGYMQEASETRILAECTESGVWEVTQQPTCIPVKCGAVQQAFQVASSVVVTCTDNDAFRSICSFSCNAGLFVNAAANMTICQNDGMWSVPSSGLPTVSCLPKMCPVVIPTDRLPSHMVQVSDCLGESNVQSICSSSNFRCQSGFRMIGSIAFECSTSGTWKRASEGKCEEGCPVSQFADPNFFGCRPLTICHQGYELVPSTQTSDRICAPFTECTDGEFQAVSSTRTSDRQCQQISRECEPGWYESTSPTRISDRNCTQCSVCESGLTFQPAGTCDGSPNFKPCQSCKRCTPLQFKMTSCTPSADTVCQLLQTCPIGNAELGLEVEAPTATTDRTCGPTLAQSALPPRNRMWARGSLLLSGIETSALKVSASEWNDQFVEVLIAGIRTAVQTYASDVRVSLTKLEVLSWENLESREPREDNEDLLQVSYLVDVATTMTSSNELDRQARILRNLLGNVERLDTAFREKIAHGPDGLEQMAVHPTTRQPRTLSSRGEVATKSASLDIIPLIVLGVTLFLGILILGIVLIRRKRAHANIYSWSGNKREQKDTYALDPIQYPFKPSSEPTGNVDTMLTVLEIEGARGRRLTFYGAGSEEPLTYRDGPSTAM
eukprot:gene1977-5057_t